MTARIRKMHELHNRSNEIEALLRSTELAKDRQTQLLDEQAFILTEKMAWADAMNDNEWLEFLTELAKEN